MLNLIGAGSTHTCDGLTRRDFLQAGTLGAIGLSMADAASMQSIANAAEGTKPANDDRACIMIFNLGAPSQLDTFDPKPEAPREIRGPFSAIATKSPEIQISEIFPKHAELADRISFVRSCNHSAPAVHDAGWQMMQTGRFFTGGINSPHVGSIAAYRLGRKTDLPPFVVLPELMGSGGGNLPNGQAGGFLGKAYDPFALNADPSKPDFVVPDLLPPKQIGEARLDRRRKMRDVVEQTVAGFEKSENAQLLDSSFQSAFRIITSPEARQAFDLTKEPQSVRERYGMNRFGQCCLLARRLVEAGVRFVTINTFLTVFNEVTWDIHGTLPFTSIEGMKNIVAPMYDQGYSALIEDLVDRGRLDKTLVCNLAEFGRTPRVNPAGGRDHWPQCWTVYFAGGGVRGGRVIGRSDPIGGYPAERPVTPPEVMATICHSLGLNVEDHLPGPAGRPFPVTDSGTKPIMELFA